MARKLAKARTARKTGMNRLEQKVAAELDAKLRDGKILDWRYEPIKLRLADKTYYTPDFMVLRIDGTIEFWEAKATWKSGVHWEDDARVKIKVAAEQFWAFVFVAVTDVKGEGITEVEWWNDDDRKGGEA